MLHSTIAPMGKIVSEELTAKFETPISLSFDALFAADLSGRARAFQSLVGGGMDIGKAAGLAGLMQPKTSCAVQRNTPGHHVPGSMQAPRLLCYVIPRNLCAILA